METMTIQKSFDKLPMKIRNLLLNGKNVTIKNHLFFPCRVNDLIFHVINEDDIFSPHLYLSRSAYEAFKSKRYGKTIDVITSHDIEFLYNAYASSDSEGCYTMKKELFVIKREETDLFSIVGYTRLGECLACLNQDVLQAMKSFLSVHHVAMKDRLMKCDTMPKVFGQSITFIQ